MQTFFDYILEDVTPAGAEYNPSIARPYCKMCKKDAWLSWTGKYSDYCSVDCMNRDMRANVNSERNADLPRLQESSPEPAEVFQRATLAKKVAKELKSVAQAKKAKAEALAAQEEQAHSDNEFRLQQQQLKHMAEVLQWDRMFSLAEKEDMNEHSEGRSGRETGDNRRPDADKQVNEVDTEAGKRAKAESKPQLAKRTSRHTLDDDKGQGGALHADEEGHEEVKRPIDGKPNRRLAEEGRVYKQTISGDDECRVKERLVQLETETRETHKRLRQLEGKAAKSEQAIKHELTSHPAKVRGRATQVTHADDSDRHMSTIRNDQLNSQKDAAKAGETARISDNAVRKSKTTQEGRRRKLQPVAERQLEEQRLRAGSNNTEPSQNRNAPKFRKESFSEEPTSATFVANQVKEAGDCAVCELRQSIVLPRGHAKAITQATDSNLKKKKLHITTDDLAMLRSAALTQLRLEMDGLRKQDAFIRGYVGSLWIWLDSAKGVNRLRLSFGDSLFVIVRCPTQEHQWKKWRSRCSLNLRWDEDWTVPIRYRNYPSHRYMRIELWKANFRHERASFLGEGQVPFPCFATRWNGDVQLCWNTLLGGDRIDLDCGQLHLGLKFSPVRREREGTDVCDTARDRRKIRRIKALSHETKGWSRLKLPADKTDEAVQVNLNSAPVVVSAGAPAVPSLAPLVQPSRRADESLQVDATATVSSTAVGADISRPLTIPEACDGVQADGEQHTEQVCSSNKTVSTTNPTEQVLPIPDVTEEVLDTMVPAVLGQMDEYACRVEGVHEVLGVDFDSRDFLDRTRASPGCRVTCSNRLCCRSVRSQDMRDLFEEEEFRAWGLCSACQHTVFPTKGPPKPPIKVILGEENGSPYSEFRLDSCVPVAFPDFTVVWPSSAHLFVAQGFTRLELQERIRQCQTRSELRAVLRAPLLRHFLRKDWESFKYRALKVCLDLKVDQHPRLQLLLSGTGNCQIFCPKREDTIYMSISGSCDLGEAVGKILMDKRSEFQPY
ncbi:putative swarming motility protein YbiA [Toxoplasma gondii RUB]|uniref:Swarming motility protein ybiA n=9 Tax=Toxoplasma gondii TaxID=5811 RepID=B9Q1U7_TOXGV|nr:hypothetical protein TGGT1_266890 [Toxoplasma gondii GT1]ESS33511.1 putative swarming motility protein YbiA [Toxoplasma gondii VEG]KAF4644114.1 hypothetical protein TGRH88_011120 [Toxoplasma gondii]KFG28140.1 putative swarming motility protein YbiA [Toxoplasma gondii p89]KFG38748.1 putative swarming motility protein YbiA [Toxoplasma gondii GAB2-2007-GAL-DOM2]KFG43171.1 putative swarming motility protein YbiA [Toxoplasma gondii FOU]KFG58862.1 putative swarming motility protein YbiA [Toxopla